MISATAFFDTPEYRKALFAFAPAAGLVMLTGTCTATRWHELNATIAAAAPAGTTDRGLPVNAVTPDHPVMKGFRSRRGEDGSTT